MRGLDFLESNLDSWVGSLNFRRDAPTSLNPHFGAILGYNILFLVSQTVDGQQLYTPVQMLLPAIVLSVVLVKKSGIVPERFEAGNSNLKLVDVVDRKQGAPVTAGIIEIVKSEPCEFDYDNDCAVIYCIDGSFLLKEGEIKTNVQPGDVVYIPKKKGLKVEWSSPSIGRGFYVTYPHWR